MENQMTEETIQQYRDYLIAEEHETGTVGKYLRDIRSFFMWLSGKKVEKTLMVEWKEHLVQSGYLPSTVNSMLSVLNGFLKFMGWEKCRAKLLRIQKTSFRRKERDLQQNEYERLKSTARLRGNKRLLLLMETICGTGIRVSEVKYITVEAAKKRKAEILLKGKVRVILLAEKLCQKLLGYAKNRKFPKERFL